MRVQLPKIQRQQELTKYLEDNPFLTDEELSRLFSVSIQTIRLDRLELGIPELRGRLKQVAEKAHASLKSLQGTEVVGELLDLELNDNGFSSLLIDETMVFERTQIARGHYLFAQANSLAIALIDTPTALTGTARVIFKRPVSLGEKVIARAAVLHSVANKYRVKVTSRVNREVVMEGLFTVFAVEHKEALLS